MLEKESDYQTQGLEKKVLHLSINGKSYVWHQQYITGAELRKLGHISNEDDVFLAIKKPWENEHILDDTKVDLARPQIEHFFSKLTIVLIVNGREKSWDEKTITFEQAVVLAFGSYDSNPNKVYTVTYDRGPIKNEEGSLVKGETIFVKNKMILNVTATDKS